MADSATNSGNLTGQNVCNDLAAPYKSAQTATVAVFWVAGD